MKTSQEFNNITDNQTKSHVDNMLRIKRMIHRFHTTLPIMQMSDLDDEDNKKIKIKKGMRR